MVVASLGLLVEEVRIGDKEVGSIMTTTLVLAPMLLAGGGGGSITWVAGRGSTNR